MSSVNPPPANADGTCDAEADAEADVDVSAIAPSRSSEPGPLLNPFSEAFDPLAALRAPADSLLSTLRLSRDRRTFAAAGPLNNIAACASLQQAPFRLLRAAIPLAPSSAHVARRVGVAGMPSSSASSSVGLSTTRTVTVANAASLKRGRHHVSSSDIVPRRTSLRIRGVLQAVMRKCADGPFSILAKAVTHRLCVRVVTRRRHAVRGSLTGRLVVYDKHFNLIVRDATVVELAHGTSRCPLIFVRGENVVVVSLA